ncbi:DUF4148 domain-containing protein [Trinickia mobilis]|uniref:DUF4148 domain-containing protein n=1 Tax=Trinickia mobilis TaxID=2816356 RepID=UPI001A8E6EC3|nr:DUF4148 domain-containing protein [Trinickia mobilis]
MKRILIASLLTVTTALPIAAFAQSGPTRAQARAELVELQQAGYRGTTSDATYPSELLAAEQRAAALHASRTNSVADSGYGLSTSGSNAAGRRTAVWAATTDARSIYFGQ